MRILIAANCVSGPFAAGKDQTFRSDQMTQEVDDKLRNMLMERTSSRVSDALKLRYVIARI